jgi:phosphate transport system substrate-binding protein
MKRLIGNKEYEMKKTIAMIIALTLFAGIFAACGQAQDGTSAGGTASGTGGKISVVGSTSVGPLMEKLAEGYGAKNAGLSVDIQQVGSAAGIQAAIDGSADIGMSSRDLTEDEKAKGLVPVSIAIDGIAVIVNKANGVSALTSEQIQKIYTGEITNWKDVGGSDAPITLIVREEGSGTRDAFETLLKLQKEVKSADGKTTKESTVSEKALVQQGNGGIKAGVAGNPNAIGYLSLGMVDDTVKAVTVDNVQATVDNINNKSYKLQRPFLVVTKGEAAGSAKDFIGYILSAEGQALAEKDGYIKVK